MSIICSWLIYELQMVCSWLAVSSCSRLNYMTFSSLVHYFFIICSSLVHHSFMTYSRLVNDLFMTFYLLMSCSKLFTTCSHQFVSSFSLAQLSPSMFSGFLVMPPLTVCLPVCYQNPDVQTWLLQPCQQGPHAENLHCPRVWNL